MTSLFKATHIDRDDFDADHYADFMRDSHRSRITLDQLDIAKRQQKKKENLLSRIHYLKMKEHARVKNEFIRKIEQDLRISNLPSVKEKLKVQKRSGLTTSPLQNSNEQLAETTESAKSLEKATQISHHRKTMPQADSPRTEKLKTNLNKFNNMSSSIV